MVPASANKLNVQGMRAASKDAWRRRLPRGRAAALCVALLLALAGILVFAWSRPVNAPTSPKRGAPSASRLAATPALPNLLRPITPELALKQNQERAFTTRPDDPAAPFKLDKVEAPVKQRAIECLTQAVYYEAAGEPLDGQRAVAQVVINRVHHHGFPPSVCETVYQGSDRPTGCQFTFTCDGSLARPPVASLWQRARKVAAEALAGHVFAPVGHATHYHADYVLPYWADSLDKEVQIGHHIFYRLPGGLGAKSAFAQRYSAREPAPLAPSAVEVAIGAIQDAAKVETMNNPAPSSIETALAAPAPTPKEPLLRADEERGTLLISAPPPTALPKSNSSVTNCDNQPSSRPVQPATAIGRRVGGAPISSCR